MACVVPIQHADLSSVWLSLTGGFRCAHIASESAGRRVQTAELIITVQAATTAKGRPVRGMMAAGQQTTTLIWLKFLISKKKVCLKLSVWLKCWISSFYLIAHHQARTGLLSAMWKSRSLPFWPVGEWPRCHRHVNVACPCHFETSEANARYQSNC